MPNLNSVQLMGNLTRDPELKYTPKGLAVTEIGLAINRTFRVGEEKRVETTFVDVELWGRTAEIAGEFLKKGRTVFIEGRLKLETWDDKQSGQKRSKMKVVAENMQLLGGREDSGGQREASPATAQRQAHRPASAKPPLDPDLDSPDEDDVPF